MLYKKKNYKERFTACKCHCSFLELEQVLWKTGSLATNCEHNQGGFPLGTHVYPLFEVSTDGKKTTVASSIKFNKLQKPVQLHHAPTQLSCSFPMQI